MSGDSGEEKREIERQVVKDVVEASGEIMRLILDIHRLPRNTDFFKEHTNSLLQEALNANIGGRLHAARFLIWEYDSGPHEYFKDMPLTLHH